MGREINVVICDDEAVAISIISASVEALFSSRGITAQIKKFTSAKRCLSWLKSNPADLIFLDIAMPEADGVDFGRQIADLGKDPKPDIIFVSSRQDRVFETFEIQPFDFVRKDNFMKDISDTLNRYIEKRLSENKASHWFEMQGTNGISMVNADLVTYFESYRNTQTAHLTDGTSLTLHSTMDRILEQVEKIDFIRVHKGYIVSCRSIKNFGRNEVLLFTGERIPVGRAYHDGAAEAFMRYIRMNGAVGIG